jgi:hypothetical protein
MALLYSADMSFEPNCGKYSKRQPKTEFRRQNSGDRIQKTGVRSQNSRDGSQETVGKPVFFVHFEKVGGVVQLAAFLVETLVLDLRS